MLGDGNLEVWSWQKPFYPVDFQPKEHQLVFMASPHVFFSKALWYCSFGKYGPLETKDSQEKRPI